MCDITIIGIGNPDRGDDGAGWALIDAIQDLLPPCIVCRKSRGDISELLDLFSSSSTIYIIDAILCDLKAGEILQLDENNLEDFDNKATSTHALSLSRVIEMATLLEAMPKKLILYAISGKNYSLASNISFDVQNAISSLRDMLLKQKDIQRCMNKA